MLGTTVGRDIEFSEILRGFPQSLEQNAGGSKKKKGKFVSVLN
jgi:hypothetical protein